MDFIKNFDKKWIEVRENQKKADIIMFAVMVFTWIAIIAQLVFAVFGFALTYRLWAIGSTVALLTIAFVLLAKDHSRFMYLKGMFDTFEMKTW